jgi:glycosidase
MSVPAWVQDAIFYQIFPDRFYNGDPANDPPSLQPWGAAPTYQGFQGGDLRGIIHKFDYLLDLGITALYLNPIFTATSNHRYNTHDYYTIDPTLGTMEDFHALLDVAHKNQVRVVLDGVFNHCGRGFFAFNDILENGPESRYADWFHIHNYPIEAYSDGKSTSYATWWGFKELPQFNSGNPKVRQYLMDVTRYWIEQGIDGWRLDVPDEIDDDSFWAEFREVVKTANPETYTVGEIWDENPRWVGDSHFDGLMTYPLRRAILSLLDGEMPVSEFAAHQEQHSSIYPLENLHAMYLLLGSHDTRRLITKLGGDVNKVKSAFLLQFASPGAPAIYYGDEIGLEGEKDPDNRRAFPWDESNWNTDLRGYVQNLISVRKRHPALRRGDLQRVYLNEELTVYAFSRKFNSGTILIAINPSGKTRHLHIPVKGLGWKDGQTVHDLLANTHYRVAEKAIELTLSPWNGLMIG